MYSGIGLYPSAQRWLGNQIPDSLKREFKTKSGEKYLTVRACDPDLGVELETVATPTLN